MTAITTPRPPSRQPIPETARVIYKGQLFTVHQWEQEQFDGSIQKFEKLSRPDTAYVLPVMENGKIAIARQRQPGMAEYLGLIGGRIEHGETPLDAAMRELLEEGHLEAKSFVLWRSFQFLPKLDWAIYVYVARECSMADGGRLDAGEDLGLELLTLDELFEVAKYESFGDVEVALLLLRTEADMKRKSQLQTLLFE